MQKGDHGFFFLFIEGGGEEGNNGRQLLHTVRPFVAVIHLRVGVKLSGCIIWEIEGGKLTGSH